MRPLARDSSLADVAFQLTVALFSSRPNSLDPCFDSRINHRSKRPMAQLPSQTMVQPSWTSLRSSTLLPRWYDCACVCTVWCEEMLAVYCHEVLSLSPTPSSPPANKRTNGWFGSPIKTKHSNNKKNFLLLTVICFLSLACFFALCTARITSSCSCPRHRMLRLVMAQHLLLSLPAASFLHASASFQRASTPVKSQTRLASLLPRVQRFSSRYVSLLFSCPSFSPTYFPS